LIRAEWRHVLAVAPQFVLLPCGFCRCIALVEAQCTSRGRKSWHVEPSRNGGSTLVVMKSGSSHVEIFGGLSQSRRLPSRCRGFFVVIHCCKKVAGGAIVFSKENKAETLRTKYNSVQARVDSVQQDIIHRVPPSSLRDTHTRRST
jgi:hypothetical protein